MCLFWRFYFNSISVQGLFFFSVLEAKELPGEMKKRKKKHDEKKKKKKTTRKNYKEKETFSDRMTDGWRGLFIFGFLPVFLAFSLSFFLRLSLLSSSPSLYIFLTIEPSFIYSYHHLYYYYILRLECKDSTTTVHLYLHIVGRPSATHT